MKKGERCDIRATVCRDRNTIPLLTNSFFVANLQHLARFRDAHELTCVNVDPALGVKNHNLASPAGTPPQKKARLLALLHRWRDEAVSAHRAIARIALAFEPGRENAGEIGREIELLAVDAGFGPS